MNNPLYTAVCIAENDTLINAFPESELKNKLDKKYQVGEGDKIIVYEEEIDDDTQTKWVMTTKYDTTVWYPWNKGFEVCYFKKLNPNNENNQTKEVKMSDNIENLASWTKENFNSAVDGTHDAMGGIFSEMVTDAVIKLAKPNQTISYLFDSDVGRKVLMFVLPFIIGFVATANPNVIPKSDIVASYCKRAIRFNTATTLMPIMQKLYSPLKSIILELQDLEKESDSK